MFNPGAILDRLLLGKNLLRSQAREAFAQLFAHPEKHEIYGKPFLVLLQKKGERSDELSALIDFVRSKEKKYRTGRIPYLVDGCGTGGDGAHTFNISTVSCLVAAGAGAHVAKHGNRGLSSKCGSADLLAALGVKIDASYSRMLRALKRGGMGYFHAPLYHPLFRFIQPLRAELGRKRIKTIFNLTGPLLNPLGTKNQLIGVFRKDLAPMLGEAARTLKMKRALIVWNSNGLDELNASGQTWVIELQHGRLRRQRLNTHALGIKKSPNASLKGGSPKRNAEIARQILSGKETGAKREVVILNAAAVLIASGKAKNFREGLRLARRSIDSGAAKNVLRELVKSSHGA